MFMTSAWYGCLRTQSASPLWIAILVSWGIAFSVYALQAPANRIGSQHLDPAQIKILQEIITRLVFIPFSVYYMHQPFRMDFRCAGPRLSGAGYFIFREV